MKVRKVWECECGNTKLLSPPESNRLIVKGQGFHSTEAMSHASYIITRCCSDRYTILRPVVNANSLVRLWKCNCGRSKVAGNSFTIVLQGNAFAYGSPTTFAKCSNCSDRFRIAMDVEWASHLALKQQKRSNSKANRRAKKRRQKSF